MKSQTLHWRMITAITCMFIALEAVALDGAPVSLAPEGPTNDSDPEFRWEPVAGASYYRINVRNAANRVEFNQWFTAEETHCGQSQPECHIRADMPWPARSFRWKVIAKDDQRMLSDWSEWKIFFPGQSVIPASPAIPQPSSPSGIADSHRPVFTWPPADEVSRYRLQVRNANNAVVLNRWRDAAAVGCSDGVTDCSFRAPKVLSQGSYRWKLLGKNKLSDRLSSWSEWLEFEVPAAVELGAGLDERPQNKTCRLPLAPPRVSGVMAERVYPQLQISEVVVVVNAPADQRWFAVRKTGSVVSFNPANNNASTTTPFIDISSRVSADTGETGLLGLAFHPQWPIVNKAYLFYTDFINGEFVSYLSEFSSLDGGNTLSPASENRLIILDGHQNHHHKGGTINFGNDGYLYLAVGDGGKASESQNTFSLFGSMLRIDVDGGDPYAIPADNPFADGQDGAPEIYAWGFRNPWRWTIDPLTGFMWLMDVGLSSWEEVNIVEAGANYGWPIVEGYECRTAPGCDTTGLTPPLHVYPHDATGGFVAVGGFTYRGSGLPQLQEYFVFADGGDRVWVLLFDENGEPDPQLLIDGNLGDNIIRSLYQAPDGEIYIVKSNRLYRLAPANDDPLQDQFPERLSETGCVDPVDPTQLAAGLIPYDVNSKFWTDGADKLRWMALPDKERLETDEAGDLHFPAGSVLVKEFSLGGKRVETRLFARHDDGDWAGYSYAWNDSETEAHLVGPLGQELDVNGQNYSIPSRTHCMSCHSEAAGRTLGPELAQLNGDYHYAATGRTANQLTTLDVIGVLNDALPGEPDQLPAFSDINDSDASFDERARSYLHSNCSSCHRPGGTGRGPADLRYQPLELMNICNVEPAVSDLGIEDARLLAPGAPERSIVSLRLSSLGPGAMPPIGKNQVDISAAAVIDEWIAGVGECLEAHLNSHSSNWHPD